MKTPHEVLESARKWGARMVDLRVADLVGAWHHIGLPIGEVHEDTFAVGVAFEARGLPGWEGPARQVSGPRVAMDPTTAAMDPFCGVPTLGVLGTVVVGGDGQAADPLDPRGVAVRAETCLAGTGLIDAVRFGVAPEFFVFDDVRYEVGSNRGFFRVESEEGSWTTGRDEGPNLGHKVRGGGGQYPMPPADTLQDFRTEVVLTLEQLGMGVERQQRGGATSGQSRICMRSEGLVRAADGLMWVKHVVRNTARRHGKTATFLPCPLPGEPGSGMALRLSLWKQGEPLFAESEGTEAGTLARHFAGGLRRHARALSAFGKPTTNSYRRWVVGPGEGGRGTEVAARSDTRSGGREGMGGRRGVGIEYGGADPAANPYLCFAALVMAGWDGIEQRLEPGAEEALPRSLGEALTALREDGEFLFRGGVFTRDLLEAWMARKAAEIGKVEGCPHPYDYELYYDC